MKQTTRSTSRSSMRSTALLRSRMARVNRLVFVTMRYPRFNDVSVRTLPPTGCEAGLDENDRKQEHAKDVVLADIDEDLVVAAPLRFVSRGDLEGPIKKLRRACVSVYVAGQRLV